MAGFDHRVTTGFDARDMGMRKTLKKIQQDTKRFGTQSQRSFALASRAANKYRSSLSSLRNLALTGAGIAILTQGIRAVTTEFLSFDDSIVAATARFKNLIPGTAKAADEMEKLRKVAMKTGEDTQFTATQAAKGLDFFARAGFTSAEAMAVLRNQVDLATATGEDFARVADISSDLLGALGLNSENSAKKIANLKEMNAAFAVATNRANVKMEDLFETIKDTGPIAVAAGESYKSVIAMTATLASSGIKGTKAGTALKNMFTRLVKPTKDVSKGLRKIGLGTKDFVDKTGKMLPMTVNLVKIQKAMKKANLGSAESLGVWARITGLRATAGALNLTKAMGEYEKILGSLTDPQKKMIAIADAMRKGLGVQFQLVISGLTNKFFQLFNALQNDGVFSFKGIIKAIKEFDMKPVIKGVRLFIAGLKMLWKIMHPFKELIPVIVVAMWAYNAAVAVQTAMMAGGLISNMVRFARAFIMVTKMQGLATAAQWALNVAMSANPIGAVIIAIVALIAVGVLLYKNWTTVLEVFDRFTAWFDNPIFATIMTIMFPFISIPILIARNWEKVVTTFKRVVNATKRLFGFRNAFRIDGDTPNQGVGIQSKIPGRSSSQDAIHAKGKNGSQNIRGQLDVLFENTPAGTQIQSSGTSSNSDFKFVGRQDP